MEGETPNPKPQTPNKPQDFKFEVLEFVWDLDHLGFGTFRRRRGVSPALVIVVTLAILALVLLFLRQVFVYYRQIKSGDLSGLPQFTSQATFSPKLAGASVKPGVPAEAATDDDPSSGPPDANAAKLTVVEFVDYQCPFSAQVSDALRTLASAYGDRVRFQIRDFPILDIHPEALLAAEAAGCAEAQGKFWIMHDRLYALQGAIDRPSIDQAAAQSGLDAAAFKACLDMHERLKEIQADVRDGEALGLRGTPTFFFNGKRVEGAIPRDVFEKLIRSFTDR